MMRFAAALSLLIFVLSPSVALAQRTKLWIASGLSGGTYRSVYANNLANLLRDYDSFHQTSTGSGENLDLLAAAKVDVAFSQADVYAARLASDPARYDELVVIGKIADECVYIAHRTSGPVKDLKGLGNPVAGRPARIATGAAGGGMDGSWSYLTILDPNLKAAEVTHEGGTLALNQLAVGSFDAVGWVTDPTNLDHKMLRAVIANDELLLMNLSDPELVSPLPDGTRIYNAQTIKLSKKWPPPKIQTICTNALMLTRKDASPALINKLADVLSLDRKRLVGGR
jgi:TRAP-type uncharacterized transport system substrate-binding protein